MENLESLKKIGFWILVAIIFAYIANRLVKSLKYSVNKEKTIDETKLRYDTEHYKGVALRLFNAFDGWFESLAVKQAALKTILALNDDEFKLVYNIYNSNYTSGSETLTTVVEGETIGGLWDREEKVRYMERAGRLGLG